jgi:hypothetical protein
MKSEETTPHTNERVNRIQAQLASTTDDLSITPGTVNAVDGKLR